MRGKRAAKIAVLISVVCVSKEREKGETAASNTGSPLQKLQKDVMI
jgi:hypothetical protein